MNSREFSRMRAACVSDATRLWFQNFALGGPPPNIPLAQGVTWWDGTSGGFWCAMSFPPGGAMPAAIVQSAELVNTFGKDGVYYVQFAGIGYSLTRKTDSSGIVMTTVLWSDPRYCNPSVTATGNSGPTGPASPVRTIDPSGHTRTSGGRNRLQGVSHQGLGAPPCPAGVPQAVCDEANNYFSMLQGSATPPNPGWDGSNIITTLQEWWLALTGQVAIPANSLTVGALLSNAETFWKTLGNMYPGAVDAIPSGAWLFPWQFVDPSSVDAMSAVQSAFVKMKSDSAATAKLDSGVFPKFSPSGINWAVWPQMPIANANVFSKVAGDVSDMMGTLTSFVAKGASCHLFSTQSSDTIKNALVAFFPVSAFQRGKDPCLGLVAPPLPFPLPPLPPSPLPPAPQPPTGSPVYLYADTINLLVYVQAQEANAASIAQAFSQDLVTIQAKETEIVQARGAPLLFSNPNHSPPPAGWECTPAADSSGNFPGATYCLQPIRDDWAVYEAWSTQSQKHFQEIARLKAALFADEALIQDAAAHIPQGPPLPLDPPPQGYPPPGNFSRHTLFTLAPSAVSVPQVLHDLNELSANMQAHVRDANDLILAMKFDRAGAEHKLDQLNDPSITPMPDDPFVKVALQMWIDAYTQHIVDTQMLSFSIATNVGRIQSILNTVAATAGVNAPPPAPVPGTGAGGGTNSAPTPTGTSDVIPVMVGAATVAAIGFWWWAASATKAATAAVTAL